MSTTLGPLPPGTTLMEASAGTGKTWQITALVLRLLLFNRLRIEQVLVVTFTEAATAELRDRIRTRLRDAAHAVASRRADPSHRADDALLDGLVDHLVHMGEIEAAHDHLDTALRAFDQAHISTIHGFCRRVLQEHAFEGGVDFETELVTDLGELRDEVVRDFHTRVLHDASEVFVRHLNRQGLGLRRLNSLARAVGQRPELPIHATLPTAGEADGDDEHRTAVLQADVRVHADRARAALDPEALSAALVPGIMNQQSYKPAQVAKALALAADWLEQADPLLTLGKKGDHWATRILRADHVETRVNQGAAVPGHPFLDTWQDVCEAQEALFADLDVQLLRLQLELVEYVRAELPRRKAQRHIQGFSDLLRGLRDALRDADTGPRLAESLRQTFRAALIDEFQDTDPIQLEIFFELFARPPATPTHRWAHVLTVIGDPKQAIYAFRGADLGAYLGARARAERKKTMDVNWRTDEALLEQLNGLWARVADPMLYPAIKVPAVTAAHTGMRFDPGTLDPAPIQLSFIPRDPSIAQLTGKKTVSILKGWADRAIPAIVASQIAQALTSKARLEDRHTGLWRPVRPGDCAVIVRKNKQAAKVQEALRALGIPSVLHAADSVFRTSEAADLALVLAAAAEPTDGSALRTALATRLLGISAAELARLQDDEAGWERWVARFRSWQETWAQRGFMRMFRQLLAELELPARLLGLPGGERILTNLLHLAELLHQTAADQELGPLGLRRWFHRELEEESGDADARQQRLEREGDAVELVTVHRAKGLEYGLVWCPFLSDKAQLRSEERSGGFVFTDPATGTRAYALGPEDIAAHTEARLTEARAEDQRLLYVALTRARHRIHLIWGATPGAGASALGHLLHGPPRGQGSADPLATEKRFKKLDDGSIKNELQLLPGVEGGGLAVHDWAPLPPVHPPLEGVDPATLDVARFHQTQVLTDTRWRRSSFSAMVRGALHSASASAAGPDAPQDHDPLLPGESLPPEASRHGPPVRLAHFPAGAGPGTFFHELLEHLDFQEPDPAQVDALVASKLLEHGLPEDPWLAELPGALDDIVRTPLGHGLGDFCLAELSTNERFDELDFLVPVAGGDRSSSGADPRVEGATLSPAGVARAFREGASDRVPHNYPAELGRLPFVPIQGFLTGSIDLVFTHAGRWYVVDYKTNKLGEGRDDYDLASMTEVMAHHHYFLQYHLYTLALHRFLRWRLPDYDPATHLGGSFYLFLRGMSPTTGPTRGVFFDHVSPAMVALLEEELTTGGRR